MSRELSELQLQTLTSIGKNVKYIRRNLLDVRLADISSYTGVSRDVICRLEALADGEGSMGSGRVYPSISTVIKFCEGVGITPAELLDIDVRSDVSIQNRILEHCKDMLPQYAKGVTPIV